MNLWKYVGIVFFIFFILGCVPAQNNVQLNQSANGTLVANVTASGQTTESQCGGWVCISSSVRAQQYENCSIGPREECPDKCENGVCMKIERVAHVCTTGFKCMNENTKAFQQEDCSWISRTDCPWGCKDGICKEKPNVTEQPAGSTTVVADVRTLHVGEVQILGQYNLSIYLLEEERVRFLLNQIKSDWLQPGQNFTYNDLSIQVRDILFQPYEGGTKAVEYVVE